MTAASEPTPPALDLAAVHAHLSRYIGAPGELSVSSDLDWSGARFPTIPDGIAHAVEHVRDLDVQGAHGIYHRGTTVHPNAPRRGRGRAQDSMAWLALQLDVDYGKGGYAPDAATAHALVLAAPVPGPSRWVASGHGLYPVWDLAEPTEDSPFLRGLVLDLHAAVSGAFGTAGYRIDPGVTDAARVWRIPGTVNRKDDEAPVPCTAPAGVGTGKPVKVSTLRRAVSPAPAPERPVSSSVGAPLSERTFTLEQARVYVEEQALALLRAAPVGAINPTLNSAAYVVGHFVGGGFLTTATAHQLLEAALAHTAYDGRTWKAAGTITSGLRAGMLEPYTFVHDVVELPALPVSTLTPAQVPPAGPETASAPGAHASTASTEGEPDATAPDVDWSAQAIEEGAFRAELVKERRRQRVREYLAAELVPPVQVLDFMAFLSTPKVEYLVPGMLWRTGCARVFGPPGGTKSFLVLDLALCLAAGVPWRGQEIGRGVVHYVMAEGQEVNAARTASWLHDRSVMPGALVETFRPITDGVQLTPEGIAGYLPRVAAERPALIVLDTKARMMVGSVNDPRDNGALVRAVDMLRRASGGCVLLVDHTGVHDVSRAKGDNTVEAAMDTEIRCAIDRNTKIATAEVTRDKAAGAGTSWSYTLRTVGDAAVCSPISDGAVAEVPFRVEGAWWDIEANPVPEAVAEKVKGKGASAALDIYRLLAFVDGERGLTTAEIRAMLAEGPRMHEYSVVTRGLGLLSRAGVTVPGATDARVLIAPAYLPPDISAT